MPAKKTLGKAKGTNPLAMLKAVQKKKTTIRKKKEEKAAEEAAKIQKEKGWQEAKDANRGFAIVNKESVVDTPIYCKNGNRDFDERVRPGVPVVEAVQDHKDKELTCDNEFLMSLLRARLDHIDEHVLRVYNYYPLSENHCSRMNMPSHLSKPCISLMSKFDFTYGALATCDDIVKSTEKLTTLGPVERVGNKDFISHAFCLVYQLFLLRTSLRTCQKLLKRHSQKPYTVATIMIYLRYVLNPLDFVRTVSHQLITTDEASSVTIGDGKSVTLAKFTEMLLAPDTTDDFFEVFPPFTEEEAKLVKGYAAKIRQNLKIPTQQELAEKKKALTAAKKIAQGERQKIVEQMKHCTLLSGFTSASTLMNWASYRAAVEGHTAEAVSTDLVKNKLLIEREKFEEAQRAAEERRKLEAAEVEAQKKSKAANRKKKPQEGLPEDDTDRKRNKIEKPKLQQVQDSYLY